MVETRQWPDGDAITLSYDGSGDGTIVVSSSANEGLDRSMTLSVTNGVTSEDVMVSQVGLREEFVCSDGEVFTCTDGVFAVLKNR